MLKKILLLFLIGSFTILIGCSVQTEPSAPKAALSVEQIKADLIGRQAETWRFDALSEFEQFDIRGEQRQGDIIEYDVSMRLVDFNTQQHYLMDALIVYRQSNGTFQLISIVPTLYTSL